MNRTLVFSIACGLVALPMVAAEQNPIEAKMREALKRTMLQLRDADTARATLQLEKTELEQKNTDLAAKIDELNGKITKLIKQSTEEKDAADKATADLNGKIANQEVQITQFKEVIEKWKIEFQKLTDVARSKESQRSALASEVIVLQRKVASHESKNIEMFKIGSEILKRYEGFGLGTALTSREPFVGITRVKLENLMQDYADKLVDQKIKPADNPPASNQPSASKQENTKVSNSQNQGKKTTGSKASS